MKSTLPANVDRARLPEAYSAARSALAKCSNIDECLKWANKHEALASYARQVNDTSLMNYAARVQNRAVRRLGELSKRLPQGKRGPKGKLRGSAAPKSEQLKSAGVSKDQAKRAERVAAIPEETFERMVESERPPTVTAMAELGAERKREGKGASTVVLRSVVEARKKLSMISGFAAFCREHDPRDLALTVESDRATRMREAVSAIDHWLDKFVTAIGGS